MVYLESLLQLSFRKVFEILATVETVEFNFVEEGVLKWNLFNEASLR